MRWLVSVILGLVTLGFASVGSGYMSRPGIEVAVVTYPVIGRSAEDLRAWVCRHGPRDLQGVARAALTTWIIPPQRSTAPPRITIVLPRERDLNLAAHETEAWQADRVKLVRHEFSHASRIGRKMRRINVLSEGPTRSRRIAQMRNHERVWDRRTAHGRIEGLSYFQCHQ